MLILVIKIYMGIISKESLKKIFFGDEEDNKKFDTTLKSLSKTDPYSLVIRSSAYGSVLAKLPESIELRFTSEWDTLLPSSNSDLFKVFNLATNEAFNFHFKNKKLSAQVWSGNSPIELSLPLEFKAQSEEEAKRNLNYIKMLVKMNQPTQNKSGLMKPPGPHVFEDSEIMKKIFGQNAKGDNISIMVGNFMLFTKVIILEVTPEIKSILDSNGMPMVINCQVTFRSFYTFLADEIDGLLFSNKNTVLNSRNKKDKNLDL